MPEQHQSVDDAAGHGSSFTSTSSSPPSSDDYLSHGPPTPASASSPNVDVPLLAQQQNLPSGASWLQRSSSAAYINSPLNPNPISHATPRSRPASRGSAYFSRMVSEESAAFAGGAGQRGSMLLYKLASEDDNGPLPSIRRHSFGSDSALSFDGKYPSGTPRGVIPYVYNPELDETNNLDADDELHKLDDRQRFVWSWRGMANFALLILLVVGLLCLFILYPVLYFVNNDARLQMIDSNIHINATGQNPVLFQMPQLVDPDTPDDAKTRTGFDGMPYSLVFSDEFNVDGRTFYPGDDPYWEAVDLWYWATQDLEWYDPSNAFTRDGSLVLLIEQVTDLTENHDLQFRSAMVQSWNKFCFTHGYIEFRISLPGPNEETQGYWPGAWTMGNLGRPGYGATTDGMWPYSYDSCDVGTFPNQTYANGSGPAAALHTDQGRSKYNFELSWLAGQKLSACTCDGQEHAGPTVGKGRGAPEIDALEAQKNKLGDGAKGSQSAQFAPFSHDYVYENTSTDNYMIYDPLKTQANSYHGSAVQQAVSSLTDLPADIFNGSGAQFYTFGFEYWTDPNHPEEGFIVWQVGGTPSVRMGANAVDGDPLPDGSGVGRRLIPEEPMSIVLNLAIAESFQDVNLASMTFPSEMKIDYVRVYQRDGEQNIGCSPAGYPTADYIISHLEAYTNPNWTTWQQAGYSWPRNSLYDGC